MSYKQNQNCIIYEQEGQTLAELNFRETHNSIIIVDRIFVDPSLRGKGIAAKLLVELCQQAKLNHKKIRPICTYAQKWFHIHSEYSDLLDLNA